MICDESFSCLPPPQVADTLVKATRQPPTPHTQTCLYSMTSLWGLQRNGFSIWFGRSFKKDLDNFFLFFKSKIVFRAKLLIHLWACLQRLGY